MVHYAELSCLRLPVHILLTVLFSWNKVAEKFQPDMPSPHLGRNSFIFIPPAVSYKQIGFISLTSLPGSSPLCCQFSCSVVSEPLWPHESQHARPPCPSPTPGACSISCPSSWWCHPTISSSVVPFSCLQCFPTSGSFLRSQFLSSGSQKLK